MPGAYSPSRVMTGAYDGANQHPRITTTYLNQLGSDGTDTGIGARRGDPGPWLNMNSNIDHINGGTIGFSGGIVQPYTGGLGGVMTLTDGGAVTYGDPRRGVPSLYGGKFQYVRIDPNNPTPVGRGDVLYWQPAPPTPPANGTPTDILLYVVTKSPAAQVPGGVAGIALNAVVNGYYDFIQISGIAFVHFSGPAAVGAEVIATGTSATAGVMVAGNFLGWTIFTPAVANQVSPVQLNIFRGRVY